MAYQAAPQEASLGPEAKPEPKRSRCTHRYARRSARQRHTLKNLSVRITPFRTPAPHAQYQTIPHASSTCAQELVRTPAPHIQEPVRTPDPLRNSRQSGLGGLGHSRQSGLSGTEGRFGGGAFRHNRRSRRRDRRRARTRQSGRGRQQAPRPCPANSLRAPPPATAAASKEPHLSTQYPLYSPVRSPAFYSQYISQEGAPLCFTQ